MQYQIISADPHWNCSVQEEPHVLLPVATRQGSAKSFNRIDLCIDLKDLIDPSARVLCGASEMGGRITRHMLDASIPLNTALWIMFQTPDQQFLLFGTASWRIFTCDLMAKTDVLTIRYYGDFKEFQAGQSLELEEIFFVKGQSEHEVLTRYADYVAEKRVPRLNLHNWKGWGSWDYYTSEFTEKNLLENINEMVKIYPETDILQIDDGYCIGGDWQDIDRKKLPRGLAPLVDDLKKRGIKTGIWMAPFLVNKKSKIALEHPDWFLKNANGSIYCFNGGASQLLDYSQDEVVDYIRQCIRYFIRAGIAYLKLDFLAFGTYPLRSKNPMTPYERIHRCLGAIREEAGKDTYLLGCSAVFGPCVGHVDGMRTGPDIGPGATSVCMTAGCCMASYPFHRKWFQCDTDYLIVRGKGMKDEEAASCKSGVLSDEQAQTWADFLTLTGSTLLASDKLSILSEERRQLLRSVFRNAGENREYVVLDPGSGGMEGFPSMIYSNGRLGVFNLSNEEKTLILPDKTGITLPPVSSGMIHDFVWDGGNISAGNTPLQSLESTLEPFCSGQNATPVSIDSAANAILCSKRGIADGIMDGIFAPLLGNVTLQNVPFTVTDHVICVANNEQFRKIQIPVHRRISTCYLLHAAAYPTSGQWITYTVHFADGSSLEFPVNASENMLVADYHYASPWQTEATRLAWTDPIRGRGVYVIRLSLPRVQEVTGIEIGRPAQMGTHMVLALSCV